MKVKKILSYITAAILAILIIFEVLLTIFGITIFSKSNVKKQIENVNYYSEINNIIKERTENYIVQSGFDETIMDNVITEEKVKQNVDDIIDSIYDGKDANISADDIKSALDKNIQDYITKNNYKLTESMKKDVETFENEMQKIYADNVIYSKDIVQKVAQYYNIAKKAFVVALAVITILMVIISIFLIKTNTPSFAKALLVSGVIFIFLKYYSGTSVAINNILVVNNAFSKLIINIANQIIVDIFVTGIIMTILGILLIILTEKNKISSKH